MGRVARLLLYGGIVGAVVGLSKVHAAWVADPPYDYTGSFRFAWSIAYILLLAITAYGVGLPDLPRGARRGVVAAFTGPAVAAAGISLVQLLVGDALLPRFVVMGSALVLVPWNLLCVALATGARSRARAADRAVIVSGNEDGAALQHDLTTTGEQPALIVAVLTPFEATDRAGGNRRLFQTAEQEAASVVVLDRDAQADDDIVMQAADLHEAGVRIRTLSLFYEQWLGKLPVAELERVSLMFDIGEVHRSRYGRLKRILDLALAGVGAVALLVAIPLVFVANLGFNRGPLFYRQPRVGKADERFQIWKFRTMSPDTGGVLVNEWTSEDDPRITPFGRMMRSVHLDELPQVINILTGDLSVVGPRPEQPHYVEELRAKLPFYDLRHLVRPGLTGWAQVKYGYAGDERDALEKLQYEFFYLRRQSLGLDLRIIGRTIRSIMSRGGR